MTRPPTSLRTRIALLVRSLAFCALVVGMLGFVGLVVKPARSGISVGNPWHSYSSLREQSVDVMFFGTSHAFTDIDPNVIWQRKGIPSFVLGGPMQTMEVTRYYVQEAFRTQRPKVVVLEMTATGYPAVQPKDQRHRYTQNFHRLNVGYMPMTLNRVEAALFATESGDKTAVLVDAWMYHSRWPELTSKDFAVWSKHAGYEYLKGYVPRTGYRTVPSGVVASYSWEVTETLHPDVAFHLPALRAIARTCQKNGAELVLLISPTGPAGKYSFYLRSAMSVLSKEYPNVRALDMSKPGGVRGLSYKTDFADGGHLNTTGARKASIALADYLASKYRLPDRRRDPAYRSWFDDVRKHDDYIAARERSKAEELAKKRPAKQRPKPKR